MGVLYQLSYDGAGVFLLKLGRKGKKNHYYLVKMEKLLPYNLALLSIMVYSTLWPLLKKTSQDVPHFLAMAISMFVLFLVSLIFHFGFEPRTIPAKQDLLLLGLVGIVNALAFYLALVALQGLPIWHYKMIGLISPVFTAFCAYYILGEHFSYKMFVGLTIAAFGIYIAIKPS